MKEKRINFDQDRCDIKGTYKMAHGFKNWNKNPEA